MNPENLSQRAKWIKEYKLDTIQAYYDFMSQTYMTAPKFSELVSESRKHWLEEFEKARKELDS